MFKNLIPKIFYDQLQQGLEFFVQGLGFSVLYQDPTLAVIARDGAKAYLVESPEYAAKDRPELAIETDHLDELYAEIAARAPPAAASQRTPDRPTAVGRSGVCRVR